MSTPESESQPALFDVPAGPAEPETYREITGGLEVAVDRLTARLAQPPAQTAPQLVRAWITPLASLLGAAALVVGVFQLVSTDNAAQDADQRAQYEALTTRRIDLDAVLIDHPELTPYFWKGDSPDGDESQRQTIAAIAVQRVDFDAFAYDKLTYMEIAAEDGSFTASASSSEGNSDPWVLWSETIVGQFRNSPVMCKIVAEPRYDPRFVTALRNAHACRNL